jgi:hypothetical protein
MLCQKAMKRLHDLQQANAITYLFWPLSWVNPMAKPLVSYRRIDQLKARAFDCGFTNEDAKQFGKLSKTATWEALLETYGIPSQVVDTVDTGVDSQAQSLDTSDWTNDGSSPVCSFTPKIPPIF